MKTGTKRCNKVYDETSLEDQLEYYDLMKRNAKTKEIFQKEKTLYFAGPFFTEKSKEFLGCCASIAFTSVDRRRQRFDTVFFPMEADPKKYDTPKKVYDNNIDKLESCEEVIAFVSEKDVGTAFEIGYAKALGKRVTLIVYDKTDLLSQTNLMLSFGAPCIELKDFAEFLLKEPTEFIEVKDVWEGIE